MAKKKKLNQNLNQTTGKTEPEIEYNSIDQILGESGMSKYKTMDEATYKQQLADMNKSDLQFHATQIGLVPIDDRDRLTRSLLKLFREHVAAYRKPREKTKLKVDPRNLDKKVKDILSEGR